MSAPRTAAEEWKAHWPLVMATMVGLSFGGVLSLTLSVFMEPIEQAFGWSRAQIALGMTVSALIGIPLAPLGGHLIDRFGARAVALPCITLSAVALAGFSLLTGAYWQWILVWVIYALTTGLTRQTVWSRAISSSFETSRGLALAAMLTGTSLTTAFAPAIANALISAFEWRGAYLGLALGWGGLTVLLLALCFFERAVPKPASVSSPPVSLPGRPFGEAMRSRQVISIGLAIALQAAIGGAFLVHVVPLLGWAGVPRTEAAWLAGLIGFGSFASKFACGWLADRFSSGLIPFTAFVLPGVGYGLIEFARGSEGIVALAVLCVGLGSGGGIHMTNYLLSRHVGLASFGKVFGFIAAGMSVGSAIGPVLAGHVFDVTGSYSLLLLAGMPLALTAGLLVAFLGPYPDFSSRPAA